MPSTRPAKVADERLGDAAREQDVARDGGLTAAKLGKGADDAADRAEQPDHRRKDADVRQISDAMQQRRRLRAALGLRDVADALEGGVRMFGREIERALNDAGDHLAMTRRDGEQPEVIALFQQHIGRVHEVRGEDGAAPQGEQEHDDEHDRQHGQRAERIHGPAARLHELQHVLRGRLGRFLRRRRVNDDGIGRGRRRRRHRGRRADLREGQGSAPGINRGEARQNQEKPQGERERKAGGFHERSESVAFRARDASQPAGR